MRLRHLALAVILVFGLFGCTGGRPDNLGVQDPGILAECPATPNCVSSDAPPEDTEHFIAAFTFDAAPGAAWEAVRAALLDLPRTRIVREDAGYIHAESTSRIFRFVDDVELHLRPEQGLVAVRSASRVGRSDMGVNRKRVERIRAGFLERIGVG